MDIEQHLERELSFAPVIEALIADNAGKIHRAGFKVFTLVKASKEDDMKNGFDFVFQMGDITIPVRIRTPQYSKYSDLTIRSVAAFGGRTEIDKIKDGAGDIYFYAWTKRHNGTEKISRYMLVNLDVVRRKSLLLDRRNIPNGDGTKFVSISMQELKTAGALIASGIINH